MITKAIADTTFQSRCLLTITILNAKQHEEQHSHILEKYIFVFTGDVVS